MIKTSITSIKTIILFSLLLQGSMTGYAGAYSVTPRVLTAQVGDSISIDFTLDLNDPLPGSGGYHMGLFQVGAVAESPPLVHVNLTSQSSTWSFRLPLIPGDFEIRLYKGVGFSNLACVSRPIKVTAPAVIAQNPNQILVVYNSNDADSTEVANYYKARRSIPSTNMCPIALGTDTVEVTWARVTGTILPAIRTKLTKLEATSQVYYIQLVYKFPWFIEDPPRLVNGRSQPGFGVPGFFGGQSLCSHLMDPFFDCENAYNTLVATQSLADNPLNRSQSLPGFYQRQEVDDYFDPLSLSQYRQLAGAKRLYSCMHLDGPSKAKAKAIVDGNLAVEVNGRGPQGTYYFLAGRKRADLDRYYPKVQDGHDYLGWDVHRAHEIALAAGMTTNLQDGISKTLYGTYPTPVSKEKAAFVGASYESPSPTDNFSTSVSYVQGSVAVAFEFQNVDFRTGPAGAGAGASWAYDQLSAGAGAAFFTNQEIGGYQNYYPGILMRVLFQARTLGDAQANSTRALHWNAIAVGECYYKPFALQTSYAQPRQAPYRKAEPTWRKPQVKQKPDSIPE